jgi:hypothetical protein
MKRTTWIISLACCVSLLLLALGAASRSGSVNAQNDLFEQARTLHCTNGTISGRYGYRMAGNIIGVGPFALVGNFTQTPGGIITGQVTASFNGQIAKNLSFTGTFNYTSGCFGSGVLQAINGQTLTYDFQVVERGRKILLINTDPGSTFNGEATRVD